MQCLGDGTTQRGGLCQLTSAQEGRTSGPHTHQGGTYLCTFPGPIEFSRTLCCINFKERALEQYITLTLGCNEKQPVSGPEFQQLCSPSACLMIMVAWVLHLSCEFSLKGRLMQECPWPAELAVMLCQVSAMLVEVRITQVSGFDLSGLNRYRWNLGHEKIDLCRSDKKHENQPSKWLRYLLPCCCHLM